MKTNRGKIITIMQEMKSSLMRMDVHAVLDLWYELRDILEKESLM